MENQIETTGIKWIVHGVRKGLEGFFIGVNIGIMEKTMETTL